MLKVSKNNLQRELLLKMFLFKSSDVAFNDLMREAKAALLTGSIEKTKEKLTEAIELKPTPSCKQFIAVQELVVRFPKEDMEDFYKKQKKFFSQSNKFLDVDVEIEGINNRDSQSIVGRAMSLCSYK